jgi:hypothetical protein
MAIRDLIPWSRGGDVTLRRDGETDPFLMLHRETNGLFDDFSPWISRTSLRDRGEQLSPLEC